MISQNQLNRSIEYNKQKDSMPCSTYGLSEIAKRMTKRKKQSETMERNDLVFVYLRESNEFCILR